MSILVAIVTVFVVWYALIALVGIISSVEW
jgi:hypothetical protein